MTEAKRSSRYFCAFTDWQCGLPKHHWAKIWFGVAHVFGIHGAFLIFWSRQVPFSVLIFVLCQGIFAGTGITLGAHRLWSHKAFKAKLPLQYLLAYMQTAAGQGPIFKWCRDHRIHHKFVDTEADPHNSNRGFWYSHIGWLLQAEHPSFTAKKEVVDFSDLDDDPVIRFQAKYYWVLCIPVAMYIVPISILAYFWPSLGTYELICVNYLWYIMASNFTFLVNSAAHMWGHRENRSRENRVVALLALGEGHHNYHHAFPWDFKAAELSLYRYNFSTMLLDFFAWIGWAYDLKSVPSHIVRDRVKRTGDGSHETYGGNNNSKDSGHVKGVWGWGDEDMAQEDYKIAEIFMPSPNHVEDKQQR